MITIETKKRSLTRTDDPTTNVQVYGEASSTDLHKLPKNVLRRVRALKKLQMEETGVLSKYYKAVHQLDMKFAQEFDGVRKKVCLSRSSQSYNRQSTHFSATPS